MEALSFIIEGKTAFFKKPDVNSFRYFSYGHVHKVALCGILGSIIGLNGYVQQKENNSVFPEFYEKLHSLKIAIVPLSSNGKFTKKIQTFNNSTGFASSEEGGNLIVTEQWLEDVKWRVIIISDENEYYEIIKNYLLSNKCIYMPYLGKNDHPASIYKTEIIQLSETDDSKPYKSLIIKNDFSTRKLGILDIDISEKIYSYEDELPTMLGAENNFYLTDIFRVTNSKLDKVNQGAITYNLGDYNVQFI